MKSDLILGAAIVGLIAAFTGSSPAQNQKEEQQKPTTSQSDASPEPSKPDQQPAKRPSAEEKESGWRQKILESLARNENAAVALSAIVTALFTGALVCATLLLWWAGKRHSERELRAYVSITEIGTREFVPNGHPETKITIENSGKTPAYDLRIVTTFDIHKIPRDEYLHSSAQSTDESKGVLGPGVEIISGGISRRPLTPQEHQATVRGEIAAFFFGIIEYTDAFKKRRFTNFRYVGKLSREGISWNVSEKGNEAG
jgi:hypothetical protein